MVTTMCHACEAKILCMRIPSTMIVGHLQVMVSMISWGSVDRDGKRSLEEDERVSDVLYPLPNVKIHANYQQSLPSSHR